MKIKQFKLEVKNELSVLNEIATKNNFNWSKCFENAKFYEAFKEIKWHYEFNDTWCIVYDELEITIKDINQSDFDEIMYFKGNNLYMGTDYSYRIDTEEIDEEILNG